MQGQAPIVVISGKRFNERVGTLVCWPVSSDKAQDGNPFAVPIGDKRTGVGYVMCHLPRSIDWRAGAVARHPWRRLDEAALAAAMFKLNEVMTAD